MMLGEYYRITFMKEVTRNNTYHFDIIAKIVEWDITDNVLVIEQYEKRFWGKKYVGVFYINFEDIKSSKPL